MYGIVPAILAAVLLSVAVMVALVLGVCWWGTWQSQEHGRARNVDAVEEACVDNRAGFDAVAAYTTEFAQSEPDAIRIAWTPRQICVIDTDLEETCRDATQAEGDCSNGRGARRWSNGKPRTTGASSSPFTTRSPHCQPDV